MVTLTQAHREWASRAPDERFASTADIHNAALGFRTDSKRAEVPTSKIRVIAANGDIKIAAKDREIGLTNWSFNQLATVADAPGTYLTRLPAELAVECINHGLEKASRPDENRDNLMLFREHSGMTTLRALTSTKYARIWNSDITRRLVDLEAEGVWQPAPAAFDGSRGLYLSDRDMFAFMVDNDRRIFEKGPGGGLSRGFFVKNSEVGSSSFSLTRFNYEWVCGNHRVWGATDIREVKIRHVGKKAEGIAFEGLEAELIKYANESASEDEMRVEKMHKYVIGKDLDAVLDTVMGLKINGLSKGLVKQGYELAVQREDWYGAPNTVWGLAGGLTEIARDLPHADARADLEKASGKLMEIAF